MSREFFAAKNLGKSQGYREGRESESFELDGYKRAFQIVCDRLNLSPDERTAILKQVGLVVSSSVSSVPVPSNEPQIVKKKIDGREVEVCSVDGTPVHPTAPVMNKSQQWQCEKGHDFVRVRA